MATVVLPDLLHHWRSPQQPASVAVLFSILSMLLLVCYYYSTPSLFWRSRKKGGPRPNLPPSPRKLPIIGNLHQLGALPHRALRALSRRHGPLMLLHLGEVPTLVVSSAELAEEVMRSQDLAFASRPRLRFTELLNGGKALGFAPYGEYWRQARKVCVVHLLSPHRVLGFRPAREEEVARLVERISQLPSSAGGAIDVGSVLSSFTNSVICRAVVGAPAVGEGTAAEIAELVAQTTKVFGGFQVDNFFPSLGWLGKLTGTDANAARLARRWRDVLHKLVEQATQPQGCPVGKEEGGGGFLGALLSLRRGATDATGFVPSMDEILAVVQGLINAGTDTSYLVLERTLEELVKNPLAMKKAQDEVRKVVQGKHTVVEDDLIRMGYLKAVIKETLRLHPPAPLLLPRESMKSVWMRGYDIPNKARVIINAWAIARDPNCWESPEVFRPERFLCNSVDFKGSDFQFIPFGAGRRICPGMHFAMATITLALANLLYHFDWSLPEGVVAENMDMDETPGLTIRKRRSLHLRVEHNSSPQK